MFGGGGVGSSRGTKGRRISGPELTVKEQHPENKMPVCSWLGQMFHKDYSRGRKKKKIRQAQKHIEKQVRLEQSCQPSLPTVLKLN